MHEHKIIIKPTFENGLFIAQTLEAYHQGENNIWDVLGAILNLAGTTVIKHDFSTLYPFQRTHIELTITVASETKSNG